MEGLLVSKNDLINDKKNDLRRETNSLPNTLVGMWIKKVEV